MQTPFCMCGVTEIVCLRHTKVTSTCVGLATEKGRRLAGRQTEIMCLRHILIGGVRKIFIINYSY